MLARIRQEERDSLKHARSDSSAKFAMHSSVAV